MSEVKHTPGPWQYDPESGEITTSQVGLVAVVNQDGCEQAQWDADGLLLAAAPELLAALELAERWLTGLAQEPEDHEDLATIRAAIAKARGK